MINHMREGTFGSPSAASNLLVRLSAAKSGVQIRCRPCCEIFSSPESIQEHSQTASHLSRSNPASFVAVLGLNTNDEGESAMDLSLDANGDENLFQSSFQCRKCSFTTCSESQALAHCDEHETDLNDVLSIKLPIKERIPEDQEELEQLLKMNQVRIKCEQCPTNSFLADSLETLENHFENHESQIIKAEESKTANCPLCDELKLLDSIEAHLIDDHKIAVEKARKLMESVLDCGHGHETSPIYKFHCAICPMVFKNRESYQKHALRHLFERCHKCSRCGRSFKTEISLKSHLSTKHGMHNVENLNENRCSICDETFSNRVALQNHIYTIEHLHKAKKFLEDQNQEKLSSKINDQVLSMLVRSDDKPYRCNVCRLSYGQGSTLDIHLRSVAHQTRIGRLYGQGSTLDIHLRSVAHQTRIGRLSELLAAGEVDPCLPVSEQPGGLPQKTIGELVLPATKNELEKVGFIQSP
uniref:C2H2-type domain-containing protein n=1 Tax=Panagrolaimus sp. JU765 TaxID=591449 RepID=A0AC34QZV3_9BILA